MKRFFAEQIKNHSLNTHIVVIFLLLIMISSMAIISFTYLRSYRSILEFSKKTIEETSNQITQRVNNLITEAEVLVKITSLFYDQNGISVSDEKGFFYLLDVLREQKNLEGVHLGLPDGSFIGVDNLQFEGQTHYLSDFTKPLPKEAAFSLQLINRSVLPVVARWIYKDQDLKTIDAESIRTEYDSRQRPWYSGALQTQGVFWTNIYNYYPLNQPGITVSEAVRNPQGDVIAVAGVDLSLSFLAPFLKSQKIGKTGRAFILEQSGKVLVPLGFDQEDPKLQEAVYACYNHYGQEKAADFLFNSQSVSYLGSITTFPVSFGNNWLILIVVPVADLLGGLFETQLQVILISLGILFFSALLVFYFSKKISHPIVDLAKETEKIKNLDFQSDLVIRSSIQEIERMDESIQTMRRTLHSFIHYIPKDVVKELIQQGRGITLEGEKRELAIFFSEISGFSALAEHSEVEALLDSLSAYLDGLSKIILARNGTIDKYTGEGIMAFWGAPTGVAEPLSACRTALECQRFIREFNERQRSEKKLEFPTRIGIHCGSAIVGNIGTLERINYTAMGDAVNTASRLQGINREYQTSILVSEVVQKKGREKFLFREIDTVELKGRSAPTQLYELVAAMGATANQIDLCHSFEKALGVYRQGNRKEAEILFEAILKKYPSDFPTKLYLERLKKRGEG